jgi:hypothetical protein
MRQITHLSAQALLWVPILYFTVLITMSSVPYFSFSHEVGILPEKSFALNDPIWRIAFYIHVGLGLPSLILGIPQLSRWLLKLRRDLHQKIGRWYIAIVNYAVAPTGMYMAFYAKFGFWSGLGFFTMGLFMMWFNWKGIRAIRNKDLDGHVAWMTRSYAVATSALTFRIYHILFAMLGMAYQENYIISVWLSLIGNMWLGELAIIYYLKNKTTKLRTI